MIRRFGVRLVKEDVIPYGGGAVSTPEKVYKIATKLLELDTMAEESVQMFALDSKNNIIGVFEVSRGTVNASLIHPRDVFKRAILANAVSIMLVHNHPSGDPTPSKADIEVTHQLQEAGKILGIDVLDHVVVGDDDYISFLEEDILI